MQSLKIALSRPRNEKVQDDWINIPISSIKVLRFKKALFTLKKLTSIKNKHICDLGCGAGYFSQMLQEQGALITALDNSEQALAQTKKNVLKDIIAVRGQLPFTILQDSRYDIAVCVDVISYLPSLEHRLLISEISRILVKDGMALISTKIDFHTKGAHQKLSSLIATEFEIKVIEFSYHRLAIHVRDIVLAPKHFLRAIVNEEYKKRGLEKRRGFFRFWYYIGSCRWMKLFWRVLEYFTQPLESLFVKSEKTISFLEILCRSLMGEHGISSVIFLVRKKDLKINFK